LREITTVDLLLDQPLHARNADSHVGCDRVYGHIPLD